MFFSASLKKLYDDYEAFARPLLCQMLVNSLGFAICFIALLSLTVVVIDFIGNPFFDDLSSTMYILAGFGKDFVFTVEVLLFAVAFICHTLIHILTLISGTLIFVAAIIEVTLRGVWTMLIYGLDDVRRHKINRSLFWGPIVSRLKLWLPVRGTLFAALIVALVVLVGVVGRLALSHNEMHNLAIAPMIEAPLPKLPPRGFLASELDAFAVCDAAPNQQEINA